MNKRLSILAAAITATALPLLVACGSDAQPPVNAPAPSASSAAPDASAPAPTPSSAPSTEPSGSPSTDPSEDTAAVKAASEKFVKTTLTIGYPDKDFDVYLARLKPLLTKAGYAEVNESSSSRKRIEKASKTFYAQRARTSPKFLSDVKVSSLTADTANTSVQFQNRTQQMSGGDWKTLRTSAKDTAKLQLVKQGDKWLVDKL